MKLNKIWLVLGLITTITTSNIEIKAGNGGAIAGGLIGGAVLGSMIAGAANRPVVYNNYYDDNGYYPEDAYQGDYYPDNYYNNYGPYGRRYYGPGY